MPLRHDGNYRGPHASHVSRSRKLGRHKTIINAAMPLVDSLLSDGRIEKISFGKVAGNGKFTPRADCIVVGSSIGANIKVLLVAEDCAQSFLIETKVDAKEAEKLAEVIKTRWMALVGEKPHVI
jgi:hypothetical protein